MCLHGVVPASARSYLAGASMLLDHFSFLVVVSHTRRAARLRLAQLGGNSSSDSAGDIWDPFLSPGRHTSRPKRLVRLCLAWLTEEHAGWGAQEGLGLASEGEGHSGVYRPPGAFDSVAGPRGH